MKLEKIEKLVANFYDRTEYVTHIRNLKQVLSQGLILKKIHYLKRPWLEPYIDVNTNLKQKTKNNSRNNFF